MLIGEILQNEVNSACVTTGNHNNDNGFMYPDIINFEKGLKKRGYEPIGISKNVPFKPSYAEYSVAFCYKYNDEIYWCHLTEIVWHSLLSDIYGRKKANEIFDTFMGFDK